MNICDKFVRKFSIDSRLSFVEFAKNFSTIGNTEIQLCPHASANDIIERRIFSIWSISFESIVERYDDKREHQWWCWINSSWIFILEKKNNILAIERLFSIVKLDNDIDVYICMKTIIS